MKGIFQRPRSYLRNLSREWIATLDEVRHLSGFEDFLRPKSLATLRKAAANGPVVILNAAKSSCDALILRSAGTVEHVTLPKLTFSDVENIVKLVQYVTIPSAAYFPFAKTVPRRLEALMEEVRTASPFVTTAENERGSTRVLRNIVDPDVIFRYVLAKLWVSVAQPVICALGLEVSD